MIRSRAKYIEHGEKSTKSELGKEKKPSEIRHIKHCLYIVDYLWGRQCLRRTT